jgi:hypothetical protein
VAPLRPVVVGDGCILCDEDLDGTCSKPRDLVGASSSATFSRSFSFCDPDPVVLSESSLEPALSAIKVACVEDLGGWGTSVTILNH